MMDCGTEMSESIASNQMGSKTYTHCGEKGGWIMSEKKYMLTENEIISFYGRGYYDGIHGLEPTPYNSEEWFNDREYHERTQHTHCCPCAAHRTCQNIGDRELANDKYYDFKCSVCGFECSATDAKFCPHCGAKVVK